MEEKIPGLFRRSWGKCMQCGTISELEEYHGLDLTRNPEGETAEGRVFPVELS